MDLTAYVTSVEETLAAAAAAGDDATRRTANALATAVEPAVRLAIMDALSELVLEVTEALDDHAVELRLEAGEVRPVISLAAAEEEPAATAAAEGGEPSRITLRLAETLKAQAERAAAREGVSLNTWLSGAVQARLRDDRRRGHAGGSRLRGWVQS
jgi:HicB family